MKTLFWISSLLILVILCSACTSSQPAGPTPTGLAATQTPAQPAATLELPAAIPTEPAAIPTEPVATQAPEQEPANAPQTTEAASPLPFSQATMDSMTDNLRNLLGAPDLELAFQSLTQSPNATNHQAALLVDALGNSYYVSLYTFQPIEFNLNQAVRPSQGGSMTPDELRVFAEQLAYRQSTRFDQVKDRLVYTAGDKSGENYFFRWEMPDTDVGGMPAILQFGLRQDGSLFSYINSLDFLP